MPLFATMTERAPSVTGVQAAGILCLLMLYVCYSSLLAVIALARYIRLLTYLLTYLV